jgi:hypothetical protein
MEDDTNTSVAWLSTSKECFAELTLLMWAGGGREIRGIV